MRYRVTHSSRYGYEETIPLSHNVVRMRPREHETQTCLQHVMLVLPSPAVKNEGFDYFGNHVTWFSLQEPHKVLQIAAESEVQVFPSGPYDVAQGPSWEQVLQLLNFAPDREILAAREFVFESPHVPWSAELADFARISFPAGRPFLACVLDLTQASIMTSNFWRAPRRSIRRSRKFSIRTRASARTSRTCKSAACARWDFRRDTSAGIW